ncbi:hypothetical protein Bbelb_126800 [Branchiostoma belcheri]|nr:hypothetical protein Bbelb_126800 [Branchiostoma belcheri]
MQDIRMFHTLQSEGQRNEQTLLNWLRPPVSDRYLDQKDTNCLTYITKPACRLTRNTTAKQNHPYLHGRSPTTVPPNAFNRSYQQNPPQLLIPYSSHNQGAL